MRCSRQPSTEGGDDGFSGQPLSTEAGGGNACDCIRIDGVGTEFRYEDVAAATQGRLPRIDDGEVRRVGDARHIGIARGVYGNGESVVWSGAAK